MYLQDQPPEEGTFANVSTDLTRAAISKQPLAQRVELLLRQSLNRGQRVH